LLRDSDEELSRTPQPSLARLDALAEQLRASGLPVDIEVSGDLAAYLLASTRPATASSRKR
jgi:hypothetical protein